MSIEETSKGWWKKHWIIMANRGFQYLNIILTFLPRQQLYNQYIINFYKWIQHFDLHYQMLYSWGCAQNTPPNCSLLGTQNRNCEKLNRHLFKIPENQCDTSAYQATKRTYESVYTKRKYNRWMIKKNLEIYIYWKVQ